MEDILNNENNDESTLKLEKNTENEKKRILLELELVRHNLKLYKRSVKSKVSKLQRINFFNAAIVKISSMIGDPRSEMNRNFNGMIGCYETILFYDKQVLKMLKDYINKANNVEAIEEIIVHIASMKVLNSEKMNEYSTDFSEVAKKKTFDFRSKKKYLTVSKNITDSLHKS